MFAVIWFRWTAFEQFQAKHLPVASEHIVLNPVFQSCIKCYILVPLVVCENNNTPFELYGVLLPVLLYSDVTLLGSSPASLTWLFSMLAAHSLCLHKFFVLIVSQWVARVRYYSLSFRLLLSTNSDSTSRNRAHDRSGMVTAVRKLLRTSDIRK